MSDNVELPVKREEGGRAATGSSRNGAGERGAAAKREGRRRRERRWWCSRPMEFVLVMSAVTMGERDDMEEKE